MASAPSAQGIRLRIIDSFRSLRGSAKGPRLVGVVVLMEDPTVLLTTAEAGGATRTEARQQKARATPSKAQPPCAEACDVSPGGPGPWPRDLLAFPPGSGPGASPRPRLRCVAVGERIPWRSLEARRARWPGSPSLLSRPRSSAPQSVCGRRCWPWAWRGLPLPHSGARGRGSGGGEPRSGGNPWRKKRMTARSR